MASEFYQRNDSGSGDSFTQHDFFPITSVLTPSSNEVLKILFKKVNDVIFVSFFLVILSI